MATLVLTKQYQDGQLLYAADFDVWLSELETFLNVTKLDGNNIQDESLTASRILRDLSLTTAKIDDLAVTTDKIASDAVTQAKLASDSVSTDKIVDEAVTTAKVADESVTSLKVDATPAIERRTLNPNGVLSNICTNASITHSQTASVAIPNLVATITTRGNPVEIRAFPTLHPSDATGSGSQLACGGIFVQRRFAGAIPVFEVYRDATLIYSERYDMRTYPGPADMNGSYVCSIPTIGPIIDQPGAGTYVYTIKWYWHVTGTPSNTSTLTCQYTQMMVREL